MVLPRGSRSQSPETASLPDFVQIVARVMEEGFVKLLSFNCKVESTLSIIVFQIIWWAPPLEKLLLIS